MHNKRLIVLSVVLCSMLTPPVYWVFLSCASTMPAKEKAWQTKRETSSGQCGAGQRQARAKRGGANGVEADGGGRRERQGWVCGRRMACHMVVVGGCNGYQLRLVGASCLLVLGFWIREFTEVLMVWDGSRSRGIIIFLLLSNWGERGRIDGTSVGVGEVAVSCGWHGSFVRLFRCFEKKKQLIKKSSNSLESPFLSM